MENYESPQVYEWKVWIYCSLLAATVPIIIPAVQFGYIFNIWSKYNKPVNRNLCSCSCWDTVFKGNADLIEINFLNVSRKSILLDDVTLLQLN